VHSFGHLFFLQRILIFSPKKCPNFFFQLGGTILRQAVPTRWGSQFDLAVSVLSNRRVVHNAFLSLNESKYVYDGPECVFVWASEWWTSIEHMWHFASYQQPILQKKFLFIHHRGKMPSPLFPPSVLSALLLLASNLTTAFWGRGYTFCSHCSKQSRIQSNSSPLATTARLLKS